MNRFYRIVTERPALTLVAVLLATVFVGSGVRFLETLNNQDSELPKSDPIVRTNDRLKEVFGDKADLLIGIEAEDVFSPGTLRKVIELSEQLKGVEGVIEDEIVSLSAVNNIEGSDWGLEVGPVVEDAPEAAEAIARLKATVRANALLNGKLVSEDGTLTVIQANVEKGHNQERTHAQVFALVERFSGPERIHVAGDAVQPQEVDQGIQKDLHVLLPVVLVLTLIGFFMCFRTWRGSGIWTSPVATLWPRRTVSCRSFRRIWALPGTRSSGSIQRPSTTTLACWWQTWSAGVETTWPGRP